MQFLLTLVTPYNTTKPADDLKENYTFTDQESLAIIANDQQNYWNFK